MPKSAAISPILDDQPIKRAADDALGFEPYVKALSDILLDPHTHTPLTLGLFGSWGSGKTSLMAMLRDKVEGANGHRTVWFNAWKYDKEEALWRALLLVLLDDLEQLLKDDPPEKIEGEPKPEELLELLREALYRDASWSEQGERNINWTQAVTAGAGVGLNLALSFLGPALAGAGMAKDALKAARESFGKGESVSQMGKLIEAFRREEIIHYQAQLRSLEQFQRNFQRLIKLLLQRPDQEPRRLVVFVDDLDRCLPDKAISVLEALKLFLDVEGCIFVLALDDDAIISAINRRYQGEVKAREYLEKIVQVPFLLPPIETVAMRSYVDSMAPNLPDPRCAEVFAVGLPPNPRQVKRTLNIFLLLYRLVEHKEDLQETITAPRLAKMVAIQHAHPDFYNFLRRRGLRYLSDLERYFRTDIERGEEKPELPEALEPFAARDDLRRLLMVLDEDDARFDTETPQALRPYLTLTRQAAPVEMPAVHIARLHFEPELVEIPPGPFLMGTSDEQIRAMLERYDWAREFKVKGWFDREQPQHEVILGSYEIGRYPVTNAEYAAFVAATGRRPPRHWQGDQPPEELVDHPVVHVTWEDAMAYVNWLQERTNQPYRLPTEAEWEKAARGADARLWPWGNDWDASRANCKPAGPGTTTPVGQYPAGASPYGCQDMAGNVREWCSTLWGNNPKRPSFPYPYRSDDGRENLDVDGLRILRGGSWRSNNPGPVRCAYRGRTIPGGRIVGSGFRVARGALSSHPVS